LALIIAQFSVQPVKQSKRGKTVSNHKPVKEHDIGIRPDRMVPQSEEAELGLLGSILVDGELYDRVAHLLTPEDFFIVRNGWVFEAFQRISRRGESIDNLSVTAELEAQDRLKEIGGRARITEIVNRTPSSFYGLTYAEFIRRAALRRRILANASTHAQLAHDENLDINDVFDQCEASWAEVHALNTGKQDTRLIAFASKTFDRVSSARASGAITGLQTGFGDLDALMNGLQPSELVFVAGRPGMGKTAWVLNVTAFQCKQQKRVGIFSLEMTGEDIVHRLVAMGTGVNSKKMRRPSLMSDQDFDAFTTGIGALDGWALEIDDRGGLSLAEITGQARAWHNRAPLDLLIVDHVGLMQGVGENRNQELERISNGFKAFAKAADIPILLCAQLSRAVENRQDKRPQLSDLRDSGALEQIADSVIMLYRDEYYYENTERPNQCDLLVRKNRHGSTGAVPLWFQPETTLFKSLARHTVDLSTYDLPYTGMKSKKGGNNDK
jgi:replicative DNA helicase